MGYSMLERPVFLERALQGVAFWIGHRQSLFCSYPLVEGAIVAEACNLIQANMDSGFVLRPECQYRNLVPTNKALDGVGPLARADMVILEDEARQSSRDANVSEHVQIVIEVKRAGAGNALIMEDLRRLYAFLEAAGSKARAFQIIVSESKVPRKYVNSKGVSILGPQPIAKCEGVYHVRRTVKAAASFEKKETAPYVCLLEVFTEAPRPLPLI